MVKAMIIDDETRATDALRLMMERFIPEIGSISVCNDARLAPEMLRQADPDLLFLDIKMPHMSGFDLLHRVPNRRFKVIFTTAFDEFAIKAIRFSAFDYLLKPIDVEELILSVKRYLESAEENAAGERLYSNMLYNIRAGSGQFRLAIHSKEGVYFLDPAHIVYCEALSNYTRFFTDDNKQFLASKTLGDYEDLLAPYGFIRSHKSVLVNRKFISYLDHQGFLVLRNATRLEVSKRRKAEVMKILSR